MKRRNVILDTGTLAAMLNRKDQYFAWAAAQLAVKKLLEKYADVPMSFADACLVRMSELYSDNVVFTTDSDFKIYRRNGKQPIPLIYPEQ